MAISKKQRRASEAPDPAAFLRVIDEGLADESVVVAAFSQALSAHLAEDPDAGPTKEGDIVQERPAPDATPTPAARMIELTRHHSFKGGV